MKKKASIESQQSLGKKKVTEHSKSKGKLLSILTAMVLTISIASCDKTELENPCPNLDFVEIQKGDNTPNPLFPVSSHVVVRAFWEELSQGDKVDVELFDKDGNLIYTRHLVFNNQHSSANYFEGVLTVPTTADEIVEARITYKDTETGCTTSTNQEI